MKIKMGLALAAQLTVACTACGGALRFAVTNDHTNLLYAVGEEATFTVAVRTSDGQVPTGGTVVATLDNYGPKKIGTETFDLAKGNVLKVRGRLQEPGFLRLCLAAPETWYVWSVGYEPERLEKGSPRPADFDAFWAQARARLSKEVPLDAQVVRVDERSTADFDYYRISFATFGRRVHGYMSVPTDRSRAPFPVDVQVAAAGFGNWTNGAPSKAWLNL